MVQIKEWQTKLASIYPNHDKSPDYLMCHLNTACSDVGRLLLRSENDPRRDEATVSALTWLFAIANHFSIDYQLAVVRRFPSVCHYCLSRPCRCDITGKRALSRTGRILPLEEVNEERRAKFNSIVNSNVDVTFEYLIEQFQAIYPTNRALLRKGGQGYVVGKMLEECGELHRAYSSFLLKSDPIDRIGSEIADVTAWVMSCWNLDDENRELTRELASMFISGCFRCRHTPCNCPTYSITAGQEEALDEVTNQLRILKGSDPNLAGLESALEAAEEARASPSPEAKRTLGEKVGSVVNLLKTVKAGTDATQGLAHGLHQAFDALHPWLPK